MEEIWVSGILALPSFFSRSMYKEMINEMQCFALCTLAECVAHYTSHWWNNFFREEIKSRSTARVGMELLKGLNKGLQLLQLCAGNDSTVVWTIVCGAGPFREVIGDVERYAQMMNRLIAIRSDFEKQEIVEQLRHKIECDCRALQTSLGYASRQDRITILESFKSRQPSNKGLVLDDALLSCLISILEKRLLSDVGTSNLVGENFLGQGNFGCVLKTKLCDQLPVAVKKFRAKDSCEAELKIFKKFLERDYPSHVVGILGCSDNSLLLELMDKNLKSLMEEKNKLSLQFSLHQSIDIMIQIAEGMRLLHSRDVIYRDLKPSNVLIQVREGQSLVVKLADFGVSKENFGTELTNTTYQGTLLYMAPEMMEEGHKYTRKVDVHSFGMVCCEILTGKQTDLTPIRLKNGERPLLPKDIPISLATLIQRCWDQEEHKRPKFEEICDELWLIKEKCVIEDAEEAIDGNIKLSFSMGGQRRLRVESAPTDHVDESSDWDDSPARSLQKKLTGYSPTPPSASNANKIKSSSSTQSTDFSDNYNVQADDGHNDNVPVPESESGALPNLHENKSSGSTADQISQFSQMPNLQRNSSGSTQPAADPNENFIENNIVQLSDDAQHWTNNGNLQVPQVPQVQSAKSKLLAWLRRPFKRRTDHEVEEIEEEEIGPKKFTYKEIEILTLNFRDKIGVGGFADVYKGCTKTGNVVAVKVVRISPSSLLDFQREISILSVIHHRNLVDLVGYCKHNTKMILVHTFMVNGSLDRWIFHNSNPYTLLSWENRFKIIQGIASGMAYLHEQCENIVLHLDLKPHNILLDEKFNPRVSDFGLSRLLDRDRSMATTLTIKGTMSYMAPEILMGTGQNDKTDVYSFGVIMLETVAGQPIRDLPAGALLEAVTALEREDFFPFKLVDLAIRKSVNAMEAKRVIQVAFLCKLPNPERPSMSSILNMLQGKIPIPSMTLSQIATIKAGYGVI